MKANIEFVFIYWIIDFSLISFSYLPIFLSLQNGIFLMKYLEIHKAHDNSRVLWQTYSPTKEKDIQWKMKHEIDFIGVTFDNSKDHWRLYNPK